jgi:hypothetical protein
MVVGNRKKERWRNIKKEKKKKKGVGSGVVGGCERNKGFLPLSCL